MIIHKDKLSQLPEDDEVEIGQHLDSVDRPSEMPVEQAMNDLPAANPVASTSTSAAPPLATTRGNNNDDVDSDRAIPS